MDFYDKLKNFFGLNTHENNSHENRYFPSSVPDSHRENNESYSAYGPPRNFNIFSDPLYIHKYFEQQMDEMLKNFGFHDFGNHFFSDHHTVPAIEDRSSSSELRDQFLKPGYENKNTIDKHHNKKVDEDLDGKLNISDLDSIFGSRPNYNYQPHIATHSQFTKMKTIVKPDGSVEIEKTVRDHLGNEETTITRKAGEQEYTIFKRRDKEGKEETTETLVNLDDKDVSKFVAPKEDIYKSSHKNPHNWFPFDKFFKLD